MRLSELELELPVSLGKPNALSQIKEALRFRLPANTRPIRFAVTKSRASRISCVISSISGLPSSKARGVQSVFELNRRVQERTERFNVVLLVPTGIGAEIGGHAGDATPVARLLSETCDSLILHPNVVNASDINEMPENSLYVEGSVITRLLMGTVGLVPTRSNRLLVVISEHDDELFVNAAINAVNAARASFGLRCARVLQVVGSLQMKAEFTSAGTAGGAIIGLDQLFDALEKDRKEYDAVAISSIITVPEEFHNTYFRSAGEMVNPWGGVEAMLTHAVSDHLNVPSAHSPMLETRSVANQDHGVVDPRMAAEAVSLTFFHSVLKGLHKSPRLSTDTSQFFEPGVISAADISCLVIPDGCLGLPTLAALEQGIPVIAVRENETLMENDLTLLPWLPNQLHIVDNYWEAVGVLCALKGGISPDSVRRPLHSIQVTSSEPAKELPETHDANEQPLYQVNR